MHFEYEISGEDFASAQILYLRLSSGTKLRRKGIAYAITGVFFVALILRERDIDLVAVLLGLIGIWSVYAGIAYLFPTWYFKRRFGRAYTTQGLAGEKYQADVNGERLEVVSRLRSWRVQWAGVSVKGEDKTIFMIFSAGTIFVFAKKYLTEEQQLELRKCAALPPG